MANIATQLHAALKKITRPGSICVSGSAAAPLPGLDTGIGPVGLPSMRPLGRLSQHPLWYSDTMSDAKALLAAAWATGDLTPLLALADLLDEQDNPDFAELLRLTIAEGQTARCDQTRFQRLLQLQEEMRERIRQHAWPDLAMESGIAMSFSRRPDPSRHEREHIVVRADRQTLHRLRSEVEGRDEVLSTQHGEELARCLLIPDRLAALQKRSDTYWAAAFTLADNFFPLSHHLGNRKAAQAEQLLRFETAVAPARIAIADLPCELVPFVAWLLADHAADKPRRVGNGEVVPGAHIFVFKNWAWRHAAALDNRDSGRAANLLRQRLRAERWRGVSAGLLVRVADDGCITLRKLVWMGFDERRRETANLKGAASTLPGAAFETVVDDLAVEAAAFVLDTPAKIRALFGRGWMRPADAVHNRGPRSRGSAVEVA